MLKNEILNVDGTNWLVREAVSEEAARNTIASARVMGSVGGKDTNTGTDGVSKVLADVVRLHPDGCECLPYGEKGTDYSALVELAECRAALAKSRADYDHLGRALSQSNLRNRVYAGALAQIDAWATSPDLNNAGFLFGEIVKEIAQAHATIAEARAAAQAGSAA